MVRQANRDGVVRRIYYTAPDMARLRLPALYIVGATAALLVVLAVGERLVYRDRVLPGVRLAGVQVAGRSTAAARASVAVAAARLEREPLVATAGSARLTLRPQAVGLAVDEGATTRAVLHAGRSGNPLSQLVGPLRRRLRPIQLTWAVGYSRPAAEKALSRWAGVVHRPPVEGNLRLHGTTVAPIWPRPGQRLDPSGAVDSVAAALASPVRPALTLPVQPLQPRIDHAQVDQAAGQARRALAGPVTVTIQRLRLQLQPAVVAKALRVVQSDARLRLELDPAPLRTTMASALARVEQAPRNARFQVRDGKVRILPASTGRRLDLEPVTTAILAGNRTVTGELRPVQPQRTTTWARSLGIRERVSTFTTNHPPGQPRVQNIHRAADLLRYQLVLPGQRFSLNRAIGPRTRARGFVTAPVIANGEFSQDVGGGVSQIATTVFNAVFFGGYRIDSHQPHSYYIRRYPMGREATVSLPAPDLIFTNDTKAGILIHSAYTDSSITVTLYGDRGGRRVRAEGPRILATRAPSGSTEYLEDPNLPRGTELVEPAFTGYDVEVFRVITQPGKPTRRERFFTRYKHANPKVIRGTGGG
jgi:vancomycin resistance protein YoaR